MSPEQSTGLPFSERLVKLRVPDGACVRVCVWGARDHHFCCLHVSSLGSLFYQVAITRAHAWESSQFNLAMLI